MLKLFYLFFLPRHLEEEKIIPSCFKSPNFIQ